MRIGPKYKICKRLGASVFEKCQTQKFQLAEARAPRKSPRRRRGGSAYGAQLTEKQKARFTYGLSESQFSRYVGEAMHKRGVDSMQGLVTRLESRLDNVVYRAGLARTRRGARQMVSHGHITVNGRRINIPSYQVGLGETVAVREASRTSPLFVKSSEEQIEFRAPGWLVLGKDSLSATLKTTPSYSESELSWSPATIIQFYSR